MPIWGATEQKYCLPADHRRTLRTVSAIYPDGPPADEAEAVLAIQRQVARVMGLVTRLDVGPRPEVPPGPAIHAANHRSMADLLLSTGTFSQWGWPIRPLVAGAYFDKPGLSQMSASFAFRDNALIANSRFNAMLWFGCSS